MVLELVKLVKISEFSVFLVENNEIRNTQILI
jgi:hypothetical protein